MTTERSAQNAYFQFLDSQDGDIQQRSLLLLKKIHSFIAKCSSLIQASFSHSSLTLRLNGHLGGTKQHNFRTEQRLCLCNQELVTALMRAHAHMHSEHINRKMNLFGHAHYHFTAKWKCSKNDNSKAMTMGFIQQQAMPVIC